MPWRAFVFALFASSFALFASSFAAAQVPLDGMALLHQVADTYKNLKIFHFESVSESELISELEHNTTNSRMTLAASGPDRLRVESEAVQDWTIVVSDGKTLWRARPFTHEYMRTALAGLPLDEKNGGQEGGFMLRRSKLAMQRNSQVDQNLKTAVVLREETIEVGNVPIPCTVVVADYAPRGTGIRSWTRTFWIDNNRHIIVREESLSLGSIFPGKPFLQAEERTITRYTLASINEPLPDALFSYEPPSSFREVDKLESALFAPDASMLGRPAPELGLKTLDGASISLSSLRGKTVLLDFWATWCVPCRNQLPSVAKLYDETKNQGLVLLGVDDDETPSVAQKFSRENHYDWPSLFDGEAHAGRRAFHITAIPTLVLIDKSGMIVSIEVGSGSTAETAIHAALEKEGFQTSH